MSFFSFFLNYYHFFFSQPMEDKVFKRAPYRAWILWTRRSHHPKTCIQRQIGPFSLPDCHLSVILEWSDHTSICISQGMNTHGLRSFLDRPSNMLLLPYPGQDIRWDHASSEIPICRNNPWYWWDDLRSLGSSSLTLVTGLPRTDGSCQWREWPQHVRWSYHVEPSLVGNSQNTYELLTSAVDFFHLSAPIFFLLSVLYLVRHLPYPVINDRPVMHKVSSA